MFLPRFSRRLAFKEEHAYGLDQGKDTENKQQNAGGAQAQKIHVGIVPVKDFKNNDAQRRYDEQMRKRAEKAFH